MPQPKQIDGQSIVSWSADAVATDVNEEVILMSLERNRCYGLGPTGSDVWRKLGTPIRVSELIAQLRAEYDDTAGAMEADVLKTLTELESEGLIDVRR